MVGRAKRHARIGRISRPAQRLGTLARDLWRSWLPSGEKGYDFFPLGVDGKLILWLSDGVRDATVKDAPHESICLALDPETGREL